MWIMPDRKVASARKRAAFDQVTVGQQHRRLCFVRLNPRRVDRHYVRPVRKISNAAETLGFALRAVGATRAVKPGQLCVRRRIDEGLNFKSEWPGGRLRDCQA